VEVERDSNRELGCAMCFPCEKTTLVWAGSWHTGGTCVHSRRSIGTTRHWSRVELSSGATQTVPAGSGISSVISPVRHVCTPGYANEGSAGQSTHRRGMEVNDLCHGITSSLWASFSILHTNFWDQAYKLLRAVFSELDPCLLDL
jgi:hypothetical protein